MFVIMTAHRRRLVALVASSRLKTESYIKCHTPYCHTSYCEAATSRYQSFMIRFDSTHCLGALTRSMGSIRWFEFVMLSVGSTHWSFIDSIRLVDSRRGFDSLIRFVGAMHGLDSWRARPLALPLQKFVYRLR